ncbi:MAG: hypothetical protein JNM27_12890 [Leptospirales bacterium]|nr:hypothetical protein [Leptospirales bacterium]
MRGSYVIYILAALLACRQPLVDETYATLSEKSINGTDAFYSLFDQTKQTITHSAYLTRKAQNADIIIHFERKVGYSEEVYRNLEAWMSGLDLEQDTDSDAIAGLKTTLAVTHSVHSKQSMPRKNTKQDQPAARQRNGSTDGHFAPGSTQDEEPPTEEAKGDEDPPEDDPESAEPEKPLKPVTLVYFVRDTTLTVEFWERLADKLKEHPAESAYCKAQASFRSVSANMVPQKVPTLFGFRELVTGESLRPHVASDFSSDVFKEFPPAIRYRFLHEGEPALLVNGPFAYQTLLLGDEVDLIREFYLKRGRVILIYNAEAFLNYSMALPQHQRFARELVAYLLKDNLSQQIAVIDKLPVPPAKSGETEESMFRVFTVFPLNVIFFQLFVFLLLFLLARASPGQPLAQEAPPGSRDFTEHFRALGNLIRKSSKIK